MSSRIHIDRRMSRNRAEPARRGRASIGLVVAIAGALTLIPASAIAAQPAAPAPPTAFGGMQINRDKPIQINATTLEVRDKEKKATFIGNVVVVQGDTTLKCKLLDVFYDQDNAGDAKAPKSGPPAAGGQQQIRRLEAKGGVVVIQKEQTATGDTAIYELKTNSVVLTGNATVTQGQNVIRGDRIEVDLLTGVTQVKSRTEGESGVSGLLFPNSTKPPPKTDAEKTAPNKDAAKDTPKTAPKQARKQPLKLN